MAKDLKNAWDDDETVVPVSFFIDCTEFGLRITILFY